MQHRTVATCSSFSHVRYCVNGRHRSASEKTRVCSSRARQGRSIETVDDFEEERSFWIADTEFVAQVKQSADIFMRVLYNY